MQLGFVIDHSRCIGCHACTVACKSENEVPLASFRTWVKYTEEGTFPEVKRSFAVLRCNQCTHAPCVTICPTSALEKRASDGIVDINPKACIGCKSCMHGCPYDALYINEDTGTAEKCHFCAHRTERGLAPACAVVCPTEAIIPGDFHDPNSRVSQLKGEFDLDARKVEAGTGPNVFYREVADTGVDPNLTNLSQGFIWSQQPTGPQMDAQTFEALEAKARARTVYDVPRRQLWGGKITGYLFAKSLAAGTFPVAALATALYGLEGDATSALAIVAYVASLLFLGLTGGLLVADLKRPDRFLYILIRPNWSSWLARGTFVIVAYSALLAAGLLWSFASSAGPAGVAGGALDIATGVAGLMTAAYTGWLFAQAKGRVLWMKKAYWLHLIAQALLAGGALLVVWSALAGWPGTYTTAFGDILFIALAVHFLMIWFERKLAPTGREREYERSARLVSHGPYARLHWTVGVGAGVVLPIALLTLAPASLAPVAAVLALVGLWVEEDVFVKAGQAQPIS